MGQLVSSFLVSVGLVAPPLSSDEIETAALDQMRGAHGVLNRVAGNKRRLIRDEDARIVDLGLSMQQRGNRLAEVDAQEFRRRFRRRKLLTRSHGVFQAQLSNLEAQIEALENAPALELSLVSLQSGVDARADSSARTTRIMTSVRASLATLYDDERVASEQRSVADEMGALDDSALEAELSTLMDNDEFLGQFSTAYLDQRRLDMLNDPKSAVPRDAPSNATSVKSAADIERELGLSLPSAVLA